MDENLLLMRALKDFNIPKIITDDKPIFLRLIGDLFPRMEAESKSDPEFKSIIKKVGKEEMGLYLDIAEDMFVTKVI